MVGSKGAVCPIAKDVRPVWAGILLICAALAVAIASGTARAGDGRDGVGPSGSDELGDMSAAMQVAQTGKLIAFDIPPPPLAEALAEFSRQSGLQPDIDARLVAGLSTRGVSGSLAPEEALRQLLAGTGFAGRVADNGTVTLEKVAADGSGATVLEPITAEGHRETASGSVDGYVASRSGTGTKTDTPLIETPQSVSVITRDRLEAQGVDSLAAALRYSAGATGEQFGLDSRGYGLTIRGFNANDTGFYRDGLQLRGPAFAGFLPLDPYGAERIEILRGPTSVLYGQNNPGGIVNVVSKRPLSEPLYEVESGAGNRDRFEGKFDFGGPIDADGQWLYRVTGLGRTSDTQVDFVEQDRAFIAPALTWQPNDDTTLTFLSHYQYDNSGWTIQFYPAQGTVLPNPNGIIPSHRFTGEPAFDKYDLTQYSVGYLFEHRLDDRWTLRQNARYSRLENSQFGVFGAGLQADLVTLDRYGDASASKLDGITIDNQAEVKFATGGLGHTLLFGFDYQRSKFSDLGVSYNAQPINIYDPVYGQPVTFAGAYQDTHSTQNQFGFYAQDQIKLGDNWVFLLGGRYDLVNTKTEDTVAATSGTQKDGAFTGRAGIVYLSDIGLAPYVSYSESFQPTLGTDAAGQAFEPESGRQYEIGMKYQPPEMNSFVTVAAFDLQRQNVLTTDPNNPLAQVQTGEITARGVEFEALADLGFGLNLIGAYTFLDAEVTESNDADLGKRPVAVPEHAASLWADYTMQEGGPIPGFGFGGGIRYIGPSFGDDINTLEVPGYTLADAALHYDWGDFRFALNASNIFDKQYVASCFSEASCLYGARRTVVGTIRYRW